MEVLYRAKASLNDYKNAEAPALFFALIAVYQLYNLQKALNNQNMAILFFILQIGNVFADVLLRTRDICLQYGIFRCRYLLYSYPLNRKFARSPF